MTSENKPPAPKPHQGEVWSSTQDRIRHSFSGRGHRGDAVEELEEDVGLDSSSAFAGAELPMDSDERKAAMEAEEKRREDDQ